MKKFIVACIFINISAGAMANGLPPKIEFYGPEKDMLMRREQAIHRHNEIEKQKFIERQQEQKRYHEYMQHMLWLRRMMKPFN